MGQDSTNGNVGMNQVLAGMPWWARFILLVGPTTAMALWFAYRIDADHEASIARVESRLESHANVTSAASSTLHGFVLDQRGETRALIRLLQQVCLNTATSANERRECIQQ